MHSVCSLDAATLAATSQGGDGSVLLMVAVTFRPVPVSAAEPIGSVKRAGITGYGDG